MKRIYYIVYAVTMLALLLMFVFWKDMHDTVILILAAFGFILTSIFTYSNRK